MCSLMSSLQQWRTTKESAIPTLKIFLVDNSFLRCQICIYILFIGCLHVLNLVLTHPVGVKKDGSIVHFFHRVSNAYGCGHRKRRRVITCSDPTVSDEHVRWHKTGRSKAIHGNGANRGWKKILVLYKTPQRGGRPERAPWVMHQYHLGDEEDEKDGDLVVSKVFYQLPTKHMENAETETCDEEPDALAAGIGPKTPKTNTPQPRRANNGPCETLQNASILLDQVNHITFSLYLNIEPIFSKGMLRKFRQCADA
jgi:hypothetical protein